MSVLQDYISDSAARSLQAQLPNNRVQVMGQEFNPDSNRISIRLKVHASDKNNPNDQSLSQNNNNSSSQGTVRVLSSEQKGYPMASYQAMPQKVRYQPLATSSQQPQAPSTAQQQQNQQEYVSGKRPPAVPNKTPLTRTPAHKSRSSQLRS